VQFGFGQKGGMKVFAFIGNSVFMPIKNYLSFPLLELFLFFLQA